MNNSKVLCKHCGHLESDHIPPGCHACYDAGWYTQSENSIELHCYEYTVPKDTLEYLEWAYECAKENI